MYPESQVENWFKEDDLWPNAEERLDEERLDQDLAIRRSQVPLTAVISVEGFEWKPDWRGPKAQTNRADSVDGFLRNLF